MKKYFILSAILVFAFAPVFADQKLSSQSPQVQFIKGNISDKIAAVKRSAETDPALAVKAIDFVIENESILTGDRDLSSLAVAAVLSYPASEYEASKEDVLKKFSTIFNAIDDKNVKISILDKISSLYEQEEFIQSVSFVNTYLESQSENKNTDADILRKAIEVVGKMGSGTSFKFLYTAYKTECWPTLKDDLNDALIKILDKSLGEVIEITKKSDADELKLLYRLFIENEKISQTLRSDIAENMLNRTMILSGENSKAIKAPKELAQFQISLAKVLYDNNWTRASELGIAYFSCGRKQYESELISDEDFTKIILYVEKLSSRSSVKVFTGYMDYLNKETEKGNIPEKAVVLSVINALSSLGDKSAFDCLLLVTYLNYPEDVAAAARDACMRLKW